MNTQDKRFLAAALGDGRGADLPEEELGPTDFNLAHSLQWPFAPHAGIRSLTVHSVARRSPPFERLVLTASWGGDLTGIELSVGLDLALEALDTSDVFGKSEHLIGQIVSPETAPATRSTVQIDFAESLTPGAESFGLAKLRGRILWQAGSRHIIRIHRQMPAGWPDGDHHEIDESAITGRSAPLPERSRPGRTVPCSILLGVPILTPDRRKVVSVSVSNLVPTLAWLRRNAG